MVLVKSSCDNLRPNLMFQFWRDSLSKRSFFVANCVSFTAFLTCLVSCTQSPLFSTTTTTSRKLSIGDFGNWYNHATSPDGRGYIVSILRKRGQLDIKELQRIEGSLDTDFYRGYYKPPNKRSTVVFVFVKNYCLEYYYFDRLTCSRPND
eukprot:scaffold12330_cov83-Skeletonema_marinoi.AAC.29